MPNDVRQTMQGLPPADPARENQKTDKVDLRISAEQRQRWSKHCLTHGWELPDWIRSSLDRELQQSDEVRQRRWNLAINAGCTVIRLQEMVGHGPHPVQVELQRLRGYIDEYEGLSR